jgi:hypothetical protein
MIRLFEFKDVDRIMEIWLEGNVKTHSFIEESYWKIIINLYEPYYQMRKYTCMRLEMKYWDLSGWMQII